MNGVEKYVNHITARPKNVTWENMRTILAQEAGQLLELRHLEYFTQM